MQPHPLARTAGLIAIATLLLPVRGSAQDESLRGTAHPTLAIVGVTVIPMDAPGVLRDRTVLMRDGTIVRVGPRADVGVPDGAKVIDGTGRTLIPGLADMHAHLWRYYYLDLLLANGVTLARDMAGGPYQLAWRNGVRAGRLTAPRLVVGGPILEGTPPPALAGAVVNDGKVLVDDSASAARAVAEQAVAGYDFIKVYNNLPAAAYAGIIAEARTRGLPVAGHVPFAVGLRGAFQAGQVSIEHLRGYVQLAVPADAPVQPGADYASRLVAWRYADTLRLRQLAGETARAGVWNVPTLIIGANVLPSDRLHELTGRDAWTRCMPLAQQNFQQTRARVPFYARMTEDDFGAATEGVARNRQLVRALRATGAGLLAGTDMRPAGFSLHWELEQLVAAGLTPWEALETATINPARFLGEEEHAGSVTEGRRADVVLLDADPLADIRNSARIAAVVVGGRLIERKELDGMLERACARALGTAPAGTSGDDPETRRATVDQEG